MCGKREWMLAEGGGSEELTLVAKEGRWKERREGRECTPFL